MQQETRTHAFEGWVKYVFDHPVTKPEWYWGDNEEGDDEWWTLGTITIAMYLAELFEAPVFLLEKYTPEQIGQGLHYVFTWHISGYFHDASASSVPDELQQRWIQAVYILYRDLLQAICSNEYLPNPSPGSVDWICTRILAQLPARTKRQEVFSLDVLQRVLMLDSPMCQSGALWGLAHLPDSLGRVGNIVAEYLEARSNLDPRLRKIAEDVRVGNHP